MSFVNKLLQLTEVFKFTLTNGMVAFFTPYSKNLVFRGDTYQAIPMKRGSITYHSNLQVDKVDIGLGLVGIKVGGRELTIPQLIRRNYLRGMRVQIWLVDYTNTNVSSLRFDGYMNSGLSFNQGVLSFAVSSILDKLNDRFPKMIYTEACQHRLFDKYCALNRANWVTHGEVASGSSTISIHSSVFAFSNQPLNYWVPGEINFTSGLNQDLGQTMVEHGDGYVTLLLPMPEMIAVGDTFDVYPGDDRTGIMCDKRFNNYDNFLGFEYIPKPEMLAF